MGELNTVWQSVNMELLYKVTRRAVTNSQINWARVDGHQKMCNVSIWT